MTDAEFQELCDSVDAVFASLEREVDAVWEELTPKQRLMLAIKLRGNEA